MADPFFDLIRLLQPQATSWGGLEAHGVWGLSFRQRDDLLFCWLERGSCLLMRPDTEPILLAQGDFLMIRTCTPFSLVSDVAAKPMDSEQAVAAMGSHRLKLGTGPGKAATLHAGKFSFDSANEDMLAGLLPPLVHIAVRARSNKRVRQLLELNEGESRQPGPGGAFVIARLMELVLVEVLRSVSPQMGRDQQGLLAGLADTVIAKALTAMHEDVSQAWTVESLAALCHVSRSTFAARFRKVVGLGPIDYLLRWRMALAKEALRKGHQTVSQIAYAIGFQSPSAFSTAFTRAVGCAPREFAKRSAQ